MTEPNPARPDDGLHAGLIGFEKFLNSPPDYEDQCRVRDYRHEAYRRWEKLLTSILAALPKVTPSTSRDGAEGTAEDQTSSAEWNNGCDFAMTQLCNFLCVDPDAVDWDAATDTVDGDVRAVIGHILHAKFGEDWSPQTVPPKPAPDAMREGLQQLIDRFSELAKRDLPRGGVRLTKSEHRTADARFVVDECSLLLDALSAPAPSLDGARRNLSGTDLLSMDEVNRIDRALTLAATVLPADGSTHRIDHDGFEGTVQGHYVTREGKRGVVLQQIGTKVCHVYGEKWLAPSPAEAAEPMVDVAREFKTCPTCEMRQICQSIEHCAGPSHAELKERGLIPCPAVAATPSLPDREELAQAAAQRFFRSKLENLEGASMDACRDFADDVRGMSRGAGAGEAK